MNKNIIKKILMAVVILVLLRVATLFTMNILNINVTNYVELSGQEVLFADELDASVINSVLLDYNRDDRYTFYLNASKSEELLFIYEGSEYDYKIYVNDQIIMQNNSEMENGFDNQLAYSMFSINVSDYKMIDDHYLVEISLENYTNKNTDPLFFIGTHRTMTRFIELRTMYNTLIWICFLIILIISAILFRKDKARYMLIILLVSFVSVFKSILSGELYVFSNMLHMTSQNYYFFESATTAMNYLLYQALIYKLYNFKINKIYLIVYGFVFSVLSYIYIFQARGEAFLVLYLIGAIVIMSMMFNVFVKEKPYSMTLLITYSVFAGFNMYAILILAKVLKPGSLSSVVNGPQIGSVIYILGFLLAVTKTYFNKIEQYEKQEKELERIFLIRGIGHDLKLPLSVIKLNNQMMEKYDMTEKEKKNYMQTSLEAIHELEKMTDNINSYLNLQNAVGETYSTSIKESFEKLKTYYNVYNKNDYKFEVECDSNDYILSVKPLQFNRMMYNLVDNAFKYNEEGGWVKVSYILREYVIIIVEDSGIGMDQEQIDRIFKPFYRVDHSRSKDGLGLGLTVTAGIVKNIGGDISVESKKGNGTKITIRFPR